MGWNYTFNTTKINQNNRVYLSQNIINRLNLDEKTALKVLVDPSTDEIKLKPIKNNN